MQVLVTGGSGLIGQAVIENLIAHNHAVVNADLRRPTGGARLSCRFVETDLINVGQIAGAMAGCDAVVHLGGIPSAYSHPDELVFSRNVCATFSVLHAASLLGVRRTAIASSLATIGTPYAKTPTYPVFAPIDETHPLLVQDPYGLSKEVDEATARMFNRRYGMQIAAMRFALVADAERLRKQGAALTSNPGDAFLSRVLWAYVDVRDAAEVLRLAVEADQVGCEAFLVSAADTLSDHPTEELIAKYAPNVRLTKSIAGTNAAVSTEKAREILGWEPRYSWRDSS